MLISDYFNLDYDDLKDAGIFDAVLEKDSAFFINIQRLKETKCPEFKESYSRIREFFESIATLLDAAEVKGIEDKFYRAALGKFQFHEVNGINLGFADSVTGSGMGDVLRKQIIGDAFDLVKKGCRAPELFELVGLFEDGIGPDRLSDMIATIILPDIKAYTKRIMNNYDLCESTYPDIRFDNEGFALNPNKGCQILLLPIDILHELPVAKDWEDVDYAASQNETIRQEMNLEVGRAWRKWASSEKKAYFRNQLLGNRDIFDRLIEAYRGKREELFIPTSNADYFVNSLFQHIKRDVDFSTNEHGAIDSLTGALEVIDIFKEWTENNRGWAEINTSKEKSIQRLIHLCSKNYIKVNDFDFSCEPNEGPGPVDFKISRGNDKTVIEIKLSSNPDYLNGYNNQVKKYSDAENTDNMVYVFIDVGNPVRRRTLEEMHERDLRSGNRIPEVVIIDATEQLSASMRR